MKSMYVSGVSDGITLTAVQKGNDSSSAAKHINLMDCRPTSALVQRFAFQSFYSYRRGTCCHRHDDRGETRTTCLISWVSDHFIANHLAKNHCDEILRYSNSSK